MRLSYWIVNVTIALVIEFKYGVQAGLIAFFIGFVAFWILELLLGDNK